MPCVSSSRAALIASAGELPVLGKQLCRAPSSPVCAPAISIGDTSRHGRCQLFHAACSYRAQPHLSLTHLACESHWGTVCVRCSGEWPLFCCMPILVLLVGTVQFRCAHCSKLLQCCCNGALRRLCCATCGSSVWWCDVAQTPPSIYPHDVCKRQW